MKQHVNEGPSATTLLFVYLYYFDHHSRCFNVLGSTTPTLVFIRASACLRCQFGPMSNSFPGSSLFGKRTAEARNIPHEDIVYQRRTEARYVCQYQAECDASTGVSQTVLSRRNSQARCHSQTHSDTVRGLSESQSV